MDKNYVLQLVADNEIGVALAYLNSFGFDVTVLLSNYNQHHDEYLRGTLDYTVYSQQIAIVKSAIVNMTQQRPPSFDKALIIKATVIIVASKNNIALSNAVKSFIESAGYMVTLTEALDAIADNNILQHKLLYIITKDYFDMPTKWPISLTNNLTKVIPILFDDSLDQSVYMKKVSLLNKQAHDISDSIEDGIKAGFPVGALTSRLLEIQQRKINLDKDFNFLWTNPPIDCRNTLFLSSIPTILEKIEK